MAWSCRFCQREGERERRMSKLIICISTKKGGYFARCAISRIFERNHCALIGEIAIFCFVRLKTENEQPFALQYGIFADLPFLFSLNANYYWTHILCGWKRYLSCSPFASRLIHAFYENFFQIPKAWKEMLFERRWIVKFIWNCAEYLREIFDQFL